MASYLGILSPTIEDENHVKKTSPEYLIIPDTVTIAQLKTYSDDYLGMLDAVTAGEIIKERLIVQFPFGGLKSAPEAGSRDEQTGLFNFEQSGSFYKSPFDVPAIKDALLITPGDFIDLTAGAITALKAFLTTATAAGITPASTAGAALTALLDAVFTVRKERKQLSRAK